MEVLVGQFARVAGSFVEALAGLTVAYGLVEAFIKLLPVVARPGTSHGARNAIWRRYGAGMRSLWKMSGVAFLAFPALARPGQPDCQNLGPPQNRAVVDERNRALRTRHHRTRSAFGHSVVGAQSPGLSSQARRRAETATGLTKWQARCPRTARPGRTILAAAGYADSVSRLAPPVGGGHRRGNQRV